MDFFLLSFLPLCSGTPPTDFLFLSLPFVVGVAAAAGSEGPSATSAGFSPSGAVTSVVACLPAVSSSSFVMGASASGFGLAAVSFSAAGWARLSIDDDKLRVSTS